MLTASKRRSSPIGGREASSRTQDNALIARTPCAREQQLVNDTHHVRQDLPSCSDRKRSLNTNMHDQKMGQADDKLDQSTVRETR